MTLTTEDKNREKANKQVDQEKIINLWGRVGMLFSMTADEFKELEKNPKETFLKLLKEEKIVFVGESYFPNSDRLFADNINKGIDGDLEFYINKPISISEILTNKQEEGFTNGRK